GFAHKVVAGAWRLTLPDGNAALQVWQTERDPAVAAIHRTQQREQGTVGGNGQQLAGTEGPMAGRKVGRPDHYGSNERLAHPKNPSSLQSCVARHICPVPAFGHGNIWSRT